MEVQSSNSSGELISKTSIAAAFKRSTSVVASICCSNPFGTVPKRRVSKRRNSSREFPSWPLASPLASPFASPSFRLLRPAFFPDRFRNGLSHLCHLLLMLAHPPGRRGPPPARPAAPPAAAAIVPTTRRSAAARTSGRGPGPPTPPADAAPPRKRARRPAASSPWARSTASACCQASPLSSKLVGAVLGQFPEERPPLAARSRGTRPARRAGRAGYDYSATAPPRCTRPAAAPGSVAAAARGAARCSQARHCRSQYSTTKYSKRSGIAGSSALWCSTRT